MKKGREKVEKLVAQGNSDAEGSRWEIRTLSVAEAPEFHGEKVAYSCVPFDFAQGTPSTSLRVHPSATLRVNLRLHAGKKIWSLSGAEVPEFHEKKVAYPVCPSASLSEHHLLR